MAQLVERYVRNVQATSSNLVISTIQREGLLPSFFSCFTVIKRGIGRIVRAARGVGFLVYEMGKQDHQFGGVGRRCFVMQISCDVTGRRYFTIQS